MCVFESSLIYICLYIYTGQTLEQITIDLDRDNFMSAQDALKYGKASLLILYIYMYIYVDIHIYTYICRYVYVCINRRWLLIQFGLLICIYRFN